MKSAQSIPYGLKEGHLLRINQVSRGLTCDCICPFCYNPLVAKKGSRNQHHFAHYKGTDCGYALESALHLRAKELFIQHRYLMLPSVKLHGQRQPIYGPHRIHFKKVYLENYLEGIIPDIILETEHKRLLVEIKVSHGSQLKKIRRLQKLKLAAIEIDALAIYQAVSGLGQQWSDDAFSRYLLDGTAHKSWLYNPQKQWQEYNLRKQAIAKNVKHRTYKNFHRYLVQPCPQKKRFHQYGAHRQYSYADVIQDCRHCPYCIEIEHHKGWVGYREVSLEPKTVYCYGHLDWGGGAFLGK